MARCTQWKELCQHTTYRRYFGREAWLSSVPARKLDPWDTLYLKTSNDAVFAVKSIRSIQSMTPCLICARFHQLTPLQTLRIWRSSQLPLRWCHRSYASAAKLECRASLSCQLALVRL